MKRLDRLLSTWPGKICALFLGIGVITAAFYIIPHFVKSEVPNEAYTTIYICSETGKSFPHKNQEGDTIPILSPFSNKNTGYVAELCYWNADGSIKEKPTPVLLNACIGNSSPTFCPDCHRLVFGHNPRAVAGHTPPPTEDEYNARYAQHN